MQFSVQFVPVVTPTLVEIPQVQFLDLLFIPVVVMYMPVVFVWCHGQTVLKTVEIPQVPFLSRCTCPLSLSGANGQTTQKTVEIPQMPFLTRCTCPLCLSGAHGQTVLKTVEIPQAQFSDKDF